MATYLNFVNFTNYIQYGRKIQISGKIYTVTEASNGDWVIGDFARGSWDAIAWAINGAIDNGQDVRFYSPDVVEIS
jgi:hypothetical protein